MRGWSWTLLEWLRLYDGFEAFLPPEDDPVMGVARALDRLAHEPPSSRIGAADVINAVQASHLQNSETKLN